MKEYVVDMGICPAKPKFYTREEAHRFADTYCRASGTEKVSVIEEEKYVYVPNKAETADMDGGPCPGCCG